MHCHNWIPQRRMRPRLRNDGPASPDGPDGRRAVRVRSSLASQDFDMELLQRTAGVRASEAAASSGRTTPDSTVLVVPG